MRIRPALPSEAAALSELALRSKGHWGYDEAFLAACREELTLHGEELAAKRAVVAEEDGRLLGLATLEGEPPVGELGMLFVAPEAIGHGVGGALYRHVASTARGLGCTRLELDADPNAEAFYRAMGAEVVGASPSASVPGRMLPRMAAVLEP
ncbi:GNAT family N-acetyltransferase [Streptacidiphilus neutrinimicus]|uniref:GNAT family N-acetyltransferase n=1 Tax=Streptacidiphilus neutrinimicus TaxID=105420 RepID=UPI0009FCFF3C|nr:GNAT family N-acetyltransferase [Streptacidiphilus neutrinimicus]